MKTWEMIKELTESPEKKFKVKNGNRCIEMHRNILINSCSMTNFVVTEKALNLEWEEVKEPVDFMTAVKSGKRIRHELWLEYDFLEVVLYELSELSTKTMRDMILGKWYIE